MGKMGGSGFLWDKSLPLHLGLYYYNNNIILVLPFWATLPQIKRQHSNNLYTLQRVCVDRKHVYVVVEGTGGQPLHLAQGMKKKIL